jgi:hypothetical protein
MRLSTLPRLRKDFVSREGSPQKPARLFGSLKRGERSRQAGLAWSAAASLTPRPT